MEDFVSSERLTVDCVKIVEIVAYARQARLAKAYARSSVVASGIAYSIHLKA